MMIDKNEIFGILQKGLDFSKADQTELIYMGEDFSLSRFAENVIIQNISRLDHTIMARAVLGKKLGVAVTNQTDDVSIREVVQTAIEIASFQKEDPDFYSLPQSPPAPQVKGFFKKTASFSPRDRAKGIEKAVQACQVQKLSGTGIFQTENDITAVVNSLGTRQYYDETKGQYSLTASLSDNVSGWGQAYNQDVGKIDVNEVTQKAISKALLSQNPTVLPPGEYTVILEEAAVASLLLFLAFLGFGAKTFTTGRSFMAGKIGEKITGENITIVEDPYDPVMNAMPFDYEGVVKKRVPLIENGVAKGVVYNSYYANKAGVESTGHALLPNNTFGPYPKNMVMAGGTSSMEEMIASTERGILITHFWYINYLNPMKTMVTGTTRDGTFLIENGKIKSAVQNMRIGQSILEAFSNATMISQERKLCPQFGVVMYVPAMKIEEFTFIGG
jgi:PmbA protein